MKNVLLITSSPRGEMSHSTLIATELAQEIGGNLVVRELWKSPPPAIAPSWLHAAFTPEDQRTPEQKSELALSDELIAELKAADVIVIAAGLINFGMPAALKSWIDQVTRAGITFKYTENGPVGFLTGKRTILVLSYGGIYSSGPMAPMNHLEPALRTNLEFLGLTDIEIVPIEGVVFGADAVEKALQEAHSRVHEVAALAA